MDFFITICRLDGYNRGSVYLYVFLIDQDDARGAWSDNSNDSSSIYLHVMMLGEKNSTQIESLDACHQHLRYLYVYILRTQLIRKNTPWQHLGKNMMNDFVVSRIEIIKFYLIGTVIR